MPLTTTRPRPRPFHLALVAMAALALLAAATGALAGQSTRRVAKEAENSTLNRTVLTTLRGHTLYSLSVEKHGKFICTGGCLASWTPLAVQAGVKPTGPVKLGTIKRPDGKTQVTYKGLPLYSFNGDSRTGEANGEGIKDVGTWHAARVGSVSSQPPAQQPAPETPYPYRP